MTGLVLQARLDSARLPGKSLLPLGGRPLVLRVMEALKDGPWERRVLACPSDCAAAFAPLAAEAGFTLLEGPKEDVLARYCLAVNRFNLDWVVRATGDNPFVFADAAAALLREAQTLGADYSGCRGLPLGAGVEAVAAAALLQAGAEAADPFEREHVCPYLYRRPERFLLHQPLAPRRWQAPDLRMTVDTREDYERARAFYEGPREQAAAGETALPGERLIALWRTMFAEQVDLSCDSH
ncbi:MAG: spore coat polysaccharide biosynthesis protein SpsF [Treponematales bacterium]